MESQRLADGRRSETCCLATWRDATQPTAKAPSGATTPALSLRLSGGLSHHRRIAAPCHATLCLAMRRLLPQRPRIRGAHPTTQARAYLVG